MTLVGACTADSFSVPYTAPITPLTVRAIKDVFVRISPKHRPNGGTVEELNGVSEGESAE